MGRAPKEVAPELGLTEIRDLAGIISGVDEGARVEGKVWEELAWHTQGSMETSRRQSQRSRTG